MTMKIYQNQDELVYSTMHQHIQQVNDDHNLQLYEHHMAQVNAEEFEDYSTIYLNVEVFVTGEKDHRTVSMVKSMLNPKLLDMVCV